jgi:hypothetical protein
MAVATLTKIKDKRIYEKPQIRKEEAMTFPWQIIVGLVGERHACRQCSGCHGCR